jgi:hypothetical protein
MLDVQLQQNSGQILACGGAEPVVQLQEPEAHRLPAAVPRLDQAAAGAAWHILPARGLNSSTFQINVSTFCGIRRVIGPCE